jgi:acetyl esterase/lipase
MPAFIAVAANDPLRLVPASIEIYNKWRATGQQAQLFIYQNGGHGFGVRKQHKFSDTWMDRFAEWLDGNGFMKQRD